MNEWLDPHFERQYWDEEASWRAFVIYRGLPPDRRSVSVVAQTTRDEISLIQSWQSNLHWDYRSDLFWKDIRESAKKEDIDEVPVKREIVKNMRELVQREVSTLLQRSRQFAGASNVLRPGDLIRLCDRVLELEKISGAGSDVEEIDLTCLSTEDLASLIGTLEKVK